MHTGFCFLLVIGGNDTTTNLIANGAVLLARHPEQRAELVRDPSLIPQAVEEALRYDAPTQALPRIATRDVELHGQTVRAGQEVSLVWGSANHDERSFEEPERFDIHRANKRHLSLGHGVHFCMGSRVAELQLRVLWEEILQRFDNIEVQDEPERVFSSFVHGYSTLPVKVTRL